MSGVTFEEYLQFVQECASNSVSAISGALELIRNPALQAADRWRIMADAYQSVYEHAAGRAAYYQGIADLAGNAAEARTWQHLADANSYLARQKDLLANNAYVRMLANQSTVSLGNLAGPLAVATDGVELALGVETAIETGNFDQLGEASMGVLTASLFAMGINVLLGLISLHPLGRFLLMAVAAGIGAWAGKSFWDLWGEQLQGNIADLFMGAFNWQPRRDPLTLDLDGDGIESVGIDASNPILFDHDGDGIKHATGWISSDDGFLVLDRNGNGTIDSGRELFGDSTMLPSGEAAEDGFAALAVLDTNGDGRVDAADAQFNHLRVWRDLNQDGISQSSELLTLESLNITAINVDGVERNQVLANGNQIADVGTYVRSDGTEGAVGETHGTADVDLAENTFYREFPDQIPLAVGVTDLPNMGGSGRVRDLWEAASQSPELLDDLESFAQATTRAEQLSLLDNLLVEWAKTAGMSSLEQRAGERHYGVRWQQIGSVTNPRTGFLHAGGGWSDDDEDLSLLTQEEIAQRAAWEALLPRAQQLFAVLEAFNGRYFFALPEDSFEGAKSGMQVLTMHDEEDPGSSGGGGLVPFPVLRLQISEPQLEALNASYESLRESVYRSLAVQTRLQVLSDMIVLAPDPVGSGWTLGFADLEDELAIRIATNAVDGLTDLVEFDRFIGARLRTQGWNGLALVESQLRTLQITPELQQRFGELGVQLVSEAQPNVVGRTRDDSIFGTEAANSLRGGGGDDALVGHGGNDTLRGEEGDDSLLGGDGNDVLSGDSGSDVIFGDAGNDQISGGGDGDRLLGGAGDDQLLANDGHGGAGGGDSLEGGTGNDYLVGSAGSTTYAFARGDGSDVIYNVDDFWSGSDTDAAHVDTLEFKAGIAPTDVTLRRQGNDLLIAIAGAADAIRVQSHFNQDGLGGLALDQIRFADGALWDADKIRELALLGTVGDDLLVAYASNDSIDGGEGNDVIEGRAGDDTLLGGVGNDTIYSGDGNDFVDGGDGDDELFGTAGDDHLIGGAGNDRLLGGTYQGGDGGNDLLDGGAGNDTMIGGFGNDTYLFGRGDGQDSLDNDSDGYYGTPDPATNKIDALRFKEGIAANEVSLVRSGDNLIVRIAGSTDQITINRYFYDDAASARGWAVEQIQFADGTIWDVSEVKERVLAGTNLNDALTGYATNDGIEGGDGNDTIDGRAGDDSLSGGAGNDTIFSGDGNDIVAGGAGDDELFGTAGDDVLTGGDGNDRLYGGTYQGGEGGNDVLDGGAGNDTLIGGYGSDTYLFGRGDGQDSLDNDSDGYYGTLDPTPNKIDVLQLKEGIAPSDVTLARSADNLIIKISGTTDQVTIQRYFTDDGVNPRGWAIEQIRFADGTNWDVAAVKARILHGTAGADVLTAPLSGGSLYGYEGNDTLNGRAGNDHLDGGDGNDVLFGLVGSDTLVGGAGNDQLYGGTYEGGEGGDDILDGGAGNDTLIGGYGSDTYLFGRGDGQDVLNNDSNSYYGTLDPTANKVDVLQFKDGILPTDVQLVRSSNNLILRIIGSADQITIQNFFNNDGISPRGWAIDQIRFADGTTWDVATVKALSLTGTPGNDALTGFATNDAMSGNDGSDTIDGRAGDDTLLGGAGNDTIYSGDGNDYIDGGDGNDGLFGTNGDDHLIGGAGNDTLLGGTYQGGDGGNDVLDGGAGNDTLIGGYGSDTYLFGRGDGQDVLNNDSDSYYGTLDPTSGKVDVLQFKDGILPSEVSLVRSSNDLILRIVGSTDQITIQSYFYNDGSSPRGWAIEQIRFADGTSWDVATVKALSLIGAAGNDALTGYATNDSISGGDGSDTIDGRAGNDTLLGGAGNDTIYSGDGNDYIDGGDGNDGLFGTNGDDHLIGGAGNDTLLGGTYQGGDGGNDVLDGGAGNDTLIGGFGSDTYLFGRGDGQDSLDNDGDGYYGTPDPTPNKLDVLQFKEGVASTDVTLVRSADNLIIKINGTTDQVTIQRYFTNDGLSPRGWAIEQIRFADGTSWNVATVKEMTLIGGNGLDSLRGYASDDLLQGWAGNDSIVGETGNDVLQGGADNDTLSDGGGRNAFDGGAGNDSITGSSANEIFFGGTGNDNISTGAGADIVAFNRGDGSETVLASAGGDNTLSIGGGINYQDMNLRRAGNDLILDVGGNECIALQAWYSSPTHRSVVNLQMIAQAMAAFDASGSDPLLDDKVEQFNFLGLVDRFDQDRAANPALTSWALSNALLEFHNGGSDSSALGGDLAYQYGVQSSLAGIGIAPARNALADSNFGTAAQAINADDVVRSGVVRLG